MNSYRVSFYKSLLNSDGHSFKCLQRQIDVESGGIAVGPGEVERRVIGLGEKPDHRKTGQIGPVGTPPRIPESGHGLGSRFRSSFGSALSARVSVWRYHR